MTADPATHHSLPSALLREQTAPDHHRAESSPFQRRLVAGELPRALYQGFLSEMLHVWCALEASVTGLRAVPGFAPLLEPNRFRSSDIKRDLAFLNSTPAAACALTSAFCARIQAWGTELPVSLAGVLYVLEGSTNGGRFIARNVRRAYGFEGHEGTAFLDPYGDTQPQRWAEWKSAIDAALPHGGEVLVPVARETFHCIEAIGADLLALEG